MNSPPILRSYGIDLGGSDIAFHPLSFAYKHVKDNTRDLMDAIFALVIGMGLRGEYQRKRFNQWITLGRQGTVESGLAWIVLVLVLSFSRCRTGITSLGKILATFPRQNS